MRMPRSLTNVGVGNTVSSRLNAISAVVVFDRRRLIVRCWHYFVNGYGKLPCHVATSPTYDYITTPCVPPLSLLHLIVMQAVSERDLKWPFGAHTVGSQLSMIARNRLLYVLLYFAADRLRGRWERWPLLAVSDIPHSSDADAVSTVRSDAWSLCFVG